MIEMLWYLFFVCIASVYGFILYTERNIKYFWYFIFGCLFGFMFDILSFNFGYYNYPNFYSITIFGLPFTMTLAEGFSIAVSIYVFEKYIKHYIL